MDYDDNYPTCRNTNACLRGFSEKVEPHEITKTLGVEPSSTRIKGEFYFNNIPNKAHCWYLDSESHVESRDNRRHLDWIIGQIANKIEEFADLRNRGVQFDICCAWESKTNQGGPTVSPKQMGPLARLGLDVWWEVWFSSEDD
jgi:hypothetical protein